MALTVLLSILVCVVVTVHSARRRLSGWSNDSKKKGNKDKKGNDCDRRRRLGGSKKKKKKKSSSKKSSSKKSSSKKDKSKSSHDDDDDDDDCGNFWSTELPYSSQVWSTDDNDDEELEETTTTVGIECPDSLWDADDSTPCECFTGINLEGCDISRCTLTDVCTTPDSSAQLNSHQAHPDGIATFAGTTTGAGVISGLVLTAVLALIGSIIAFVCYRQRRKAYNGLAAMDVEAEADDEGAAAPDTTAKQGDIGMTALPDGETHGNAADSLMAGDQFGLR